MTWVAKSYHSSEKTIVEEDSTSDEEAIVSIQRENPPDYLRETFENCPTTLSDISNPSYEQLNEGDESTAEPLPIRIDQTKPS